ncbi:TorF family putative porin [Azoarcus sp. L1K30]|uniref:TorF family putative porin n=1 Tax=Azoarcus sp. L1K30 TaxID=2820277 RepID=UPI001B819F06|nr:TorF family putative porin [Azoarcus sp. L1K30]MBR0566926.1 TorF family putative porin [Azoarcus sp. L1K30]
MRKSLIVTALIAALPLMSTAHAEEESPFSGNFSLTTNYVFRGISQTQSNPAVQGGVDYAHSSGFYVGTWASNVGWVDDIAKTRNNMEWDFYFGYAGEAGPISYDVGAIRYFYPGNSISGVATPDTTEVYVSAGWEFLTLKYSHSVSKYLFGWTGLDTDSTRNSNYLELNAEYEIMAGWTASAHIGHQYIKHNSKASYSDWGLGVSKDIGIGTVALNYADSDANGDCSKGEPYCFGSSGKDAAGSHFYVSFSKDF